MDTVELEAPAGIKALGSLFKLTQVYLWDDTIIQKPEASQHIKKVQGDAIGSRTTDGYYLAEDMELSRQLSELSLPLSFHTNKERSGKFKLKRKNMNKKHLPAREATEDDVTTSIKVSEQEIVSPTIIQDNTSNSVECMSMVCQTESSYRGIAADGNEIRSPSLEEENSMASAAMLTSAAADEHISADRLPVVHLNYGQECDFVNSTVLSNDCEKTEAAVLVCLDDGAPAGSSTIYEDGYKEHDEGQMVHSLEGLSVADNGMRGQALCSNTNITLSKDPPAVAHSHLPYNNDKTDGENNYVSGDWSTFWDSFYARNYFYNNKTHESTWDPPPVLPHDNDKTDGENNYGSGDWSTFWDSFYARNYYYNNKTHESTWDPPPALEHLAVGEGTNESNEVVADIAAMDITVADSSSYSEQPVLRGLQHDLDLLEESRNDNRSLEQLFNDTLVEFKLAADSFENFTTTSIVNNLLEITRSSDESSFLISSGKQPQTSSLANALMEDVSVDLYNSEECAEITSYTIDNLDTCHNTVTNKKKKVRRKRSHRKSSTDNEVILSPELAFEGILEDFSPIMNKYWCQRYLLFSKYDNGIKMDEEGWFSVTPEAVAKHHASRFGGGIVVDCFTGVGGNAIQFAKTSIHVIAIDIDPKKIEYAQHNAAIYGVDDRIEFISGDSFILAAKMKADTVFLSPPWGGPDYANVKTFDINSMLKPHDGRFLFNVAKQIAPRLVMFLPKNVDLNQLAELSLSANPPWSLEVEENYLNGKLKAVTAYFCDPLVCKTSNHNCP